MIQFPFVAIVGMEDARNSLIYHAIDPRIGGTLFLGHRGCAKSTLGRAFAEVLEMVSDNYAPFVEVPLGTTEDRLLGSVDARLLVEQKVWSGRSGLIEEAHRGVLYIDEINLLPDHLADLILDSASSGQYRMERDGITRLVESRYILVGTMNPEEGDLRPQLSDRFAHGVRVRDDFSPEERMEIVRRRIEFDDRPEAFVQACAEATRSLVNEIRAARRLLASVNISNDQRMAIGTIGRRLKLEGLRAELGVIRTARCAAAWSKRTAVEERDLETAWRLCLGHRRVAEAEAPPSDPPPGANRFLSGGNPFTSIAPLDSRADGKHLFDANPFSILQIEEWLAEKPKLSSGSSAVSEKEETGSIAWMETLLASVRAGWLEDPGGLRIWRRIPEKKENIWCFVDASRSTGMNQFLSRARNLLVRMASRSRRRRFHLLLLTSGEIRWSCVNATAQGFADSLLMLREASGKSLIIEALTVLRRRIVAKRKRETHRALLLSDGLARPDPDEGLHDTILRLRSAVKKLAWNGTSAAWIAPVPKRGLRGLVARVLNALPVVRFEI